MKHTMKSFMMFKLTLIAASLGLLFAGNALAVTNGNFSNGLTGWAALGDVAVQSGAVLMTTASVAYEDDYPASTGAFNVSGQAAAEAGGALERFIGLSSGAFDLDGNFAMEGSVLTQNFNVNAGDTLSFDWNFFTNESGAYAQPDYAFAVINGALNVLAGIANATAASSPYAFSTGVGGFSYTFANAGVQRLSFGVVDVNDYSATSALWLDNVSVTPVPEPKDWMLMLAGLGFVGLMVSRNRNRIF